MHLTKIGIENIRIFRDKKELELAPINLLTGPNNSGKSTFTKMLLLMRDTFLKYPTKYRFQIMYSDKKLYFNYFENHLFPASLAFKGKSKHTFGNFESIRSKGSNVDQITIHLPFFFPEIKENNFGTLELIYTPDSNDNKLQSLGIHLESELVYKSTFSWNGDRLVKQKTNFNTEFFLRKYTSGKIYLNEENSPLEIAVSNMLEFSEYNGISNDPGFTSAHFDFRKFHYPYVGENKKIPENYFELLPLFEDTLPEEAIKELGEKETAFIERISGKNGLFSIQSQRDDLIQEGALSLVAQFNKAFAEYLLGESTSDDKPDQVFIGKYDETYERYIEKFGEVNWLNYNPSSRVEKILGILDRSIAFNLNHYTDLFSSIQLLSANETGFDTLITSNDERLFNLLRHFEQIQKYQHQKEENNQNYTVRNFISSCLEKLNMGNEIIVNEIQNYGYELLLDTGNGLLPLKNHGFGLRKFVSMILGIASHAYDQQFIMASHEQEKNRNLVFKPNVIVLEEPEANLHPGFQAILADIVLLASETFNMQFLIETHSEYLVRRFQFLVADEDTGLSHTGVAVKYFQNPAEMNKNLGQIYDLGLRTDGMLKNDFGPGFFDESSRLTIDLLKKQKPE